MQTTNRNNKTYHYAVSAIALEDDLLPRIKQLAKEKRLPAYRAASDLIRKSLDLHDRVKTKAAARPAKEENER